VRLPSLIKERSIPIKQEIRLLKKAPCSFLARPRAPSNGGLFSSHRTPCEPAGGSGQESLKSVESRFKLEVGFALRSVLNVKELIARRK
jgi:hypothetical protein